MTTDRRAFIHTLTAATAAIVLDPERLLLVPGQKTIFLPPVVGWRFDAVAYVTRHWSAFKHGPGGIGPMGVGYWRLYLSLLAAAGENSPVITKTRHQIPTDADAHAVIREINRRLPKPPPQPPTFTWDELRRNDESLSLRDLFQRP